MRETLRIPNSLKQFKTEFLGDKYEFCKISFIIFTTKDTSYEFKMDQELDYDEEWDYEQTVRDQVKITNTLEIKGRIKLASINQEDTTLSSKTASK